MEVLYPYLLGRTSTEKPPLKSGFGFLTYFIYLLLKNCAASTQWSEQTECSFFVVK